MLRGAFKGGEEEEGQERVPKVPGSAGWSLVGDQSLKLWRDASGFFTEQIEQHGPIFLTRIINVKTVVVCCATAGRQCLGEMEPRDGDLDDTEPRICPCQRQCGAIKAGDTSVSTSGPRADTRRSRKGKTHSSYAELQHACPHLLDRPAAYQAFVGRLYGEDNILLKDKADPQPDIGALREHVFGPHALSGFKDNMALLRQRILRDVHRLCDRGGDLDLYQELKALCTNATLSIFLGLKIEEEGLLQEAKDLITSHWHGLTSVPFRFNLGFGGGSGFDQAMNAKDELETLIQHRITACTGEAHEQILHAIIQATKPSGEAATCRHLLLFISALIPKALSSLLTSVVVELYTQHPSVVERGRCDDEFLERFIKETERLHPPFLAARRMLPEGQKCRLGPFMTKGEKAILCVFSQMNKDPGVYTQPKEFNPDRWLDDSVPDPMTFGWGRDRCMGKYLARSLLLTFTKTFLQETEVRFENTPDLTPKWLPVARPLQTIRARLSRRNINSNGSSGQ